MKKIKLLVMFLTIIYCLWMQGCSYYPKNWDWYEEAENVKFNIIALNASEPNIWVEKTACKNMYNSFIGGSKDKNDYASYPTFHYYRSVLEPMDTNNFLPTEIETYYKDKKIKEMTYKVSEIIKWDSYENNEIVYKWYSRVQNITRTGHYSVRYGVYARGNNRICALIINVVVSTKSREDL